MSRPGGLGICPRWEGMATADGWEKIGELRME